MTIKPSKAAPRKTMIYSIRMEINGVEKIVTLRVGDGFTELSLEKGGKLSELVREQDGEILFEKLK